MISLRWLENRCGVGEGVKHFLFEDIPESTGWPQVFGSVALFVLLVQAFTGVLLALDFAASPGDAYDSVSFIVRDIPAGRIIRGLHHWGASMMIAMVVAHAVQVFVYGAYKKPRELTWLVGVGLLLLMLAFGLTGYLLPRDNRAYWGTIVTTQIAVQAPVIGRLMERLLAAQNGIGTVTFTRFYALHVLVLPVGALMLTALHLLLVRKHGVTPSLPGQQRKIQFYPRQALKDTLAIFVVFLALLIAAVALNVPGERIADPTDTSYVPRPEWYFLFLFELLKHFHGAFEPLASIGLPSLAILLLISIPFLDKSPALSVKNRGWAAAICAAAFAGWGILTATALWSTPRVATTAALQSGYERALAFPPNDLAGFTYFRRSRCSSCHNLIEGSPKEGPTLATVNDRRPPQWSEAHIRSNSGRQNGSPELSPAEVSALAQFVAKVKPEQAEELQRLPFDVLAGADIFTRNLCQSCHRVNNWGGAIGPSLNGLSKRRSRIWVEKHFLQPAVMSPGTVMPPYHFSKQEQDALINYLYELQ